jgi:adenosine deaminase
VQTGAYPSLKEHPVDRLHRRGFAVTINTDNRLMGGSTASSELAAVADTFGWTWDDVRTVTERALAASFAPDDVKARLRDDAVRPGFAFLEG